MIETRLEKSITLDMFLGGKVSLYQPSDGYRANIDSVILASSVQASSGQTVLELGCGVGAVIFCLMARVPNLNIVAIELQKRYADLANQNAKANNFIADILECSVDAIPHKYKILEYDHVILNPPFYQENGASFSKNKEIDLAKRESNLTLDDWLEIAIKRCRVKGKIVLIHQVERLGQILKSFETMIGGIKILPITSKDGESAKRVLVMGTKGSRAPLKLLTPLIVHESSLPSTEKKTYTRLLERILREGRELPW